MTQIFNPIQVLFMYWAGYYKMVLKSTGANNLSFVLKVLY